MIAKTLSIVCIMTLLPMARAVVSSGQFSAATAPQDLTGHFIVKFKQSSDSMSAAASVIDSLGQADGKSKTKATFSDVLPNAVAAVLTKDAYNKLVGDYRSQIEYIEPEKHYYAALTLNPAGSWGLPRTSYKGPYYTLNPKPTRYYYNTQAGKGVDVYVIDTGIQTRHSLFGGRAQNVFSAFTTNVSAIEDGHGHGTHCSGTVGSSMYGIAPQVSLYGVQVLDASGSGSTSGVIAGLNFVTNIKKANPTKKMVASMSLGGGASSSLDAAVNAAIDAGVVVVVAAGNSNADSINYSPARVLNAITVGAADSSDYRASFSNYGSLVDINAPGVAITSLINGVNGVFVDGATGTWSGTSMSTPHVAGVAALLMSVNAALKTPAQVATALKNLATKNGVRNPMPNTTRDILYNNATSATP